jgi:hypothetical protein
VGFTDGNRTTRDRPTRWLHGLCAGDALPEEVQVVFVGFEGTAQPFHFDAADDVSHLALVQDGPVLLLPQTSWRPTTHHNPNGVSSYQPSDGSPSSGAAGLMSNKSRNPESGCVISARLYPRFHVLEPPFTLGSAGTQDELFGELHLARWVAGDFDFGGSTERQEPKATGVNSAARCVGPVSIVSDAGTSEGLNS